MANGTGGVMKMEASGGEPPAHERVYRELRHQVLFGTLVPGQPVTIQGLTEELGAGMTPVREALRRLVAQGALESLGNRRIAVPVLDRTSLDELTEARLALEPALAARAARQADPGRISDLQTTDGRLDTAILRGDVTGYLRENHGFHATLNALANAPILTDLVEQLWLRFGPSLRVVCGRIGTAGLPDRHKDLLDALRAGDPAAARDAMRADVSQGMDLIARSL